MSSCPASSISLSTVIATHPSSAPFEWLLEDVLSAVCTEVIAASVNDSTLALSKLMLEHQVACLIITDELQPDDNISLLSVGKLQGLKPVGLVTERSLLQCQASGKDLQDILAKAIMQPLALGVFPPKTSIGLVYQTLSERDLPYGVVKTEDELLGLISQASLLQAFNPVVIQTVLEETRQQLDNITDQLLNTQEQLHHEKQAHQHLRLDFNTTKVNLTQQGDKRAEELAEMNIQLKKDLRKRKRVEDALKETLKTLQSAQIQIIQNERMAGLGHFVAGIAHEINNPVNFIHGNLKPAREYVEDLLLLVNHYRKTDPSLARAIQTEIEEIEGIDVEFLAKDFPRLLDSMKSGTERIREIVKSLRAFSRLDEAEMKLVDVNEGIENTLMLLPNRLKAQPGQSAIRVLKTYGELPVIECFASQLNQVFWHLLTNAIDAVRSQQAQAAIGSVATDDNMATIQIRSEVIKDGWIAIYIADNGPGIPEKIRDKVFDPFYTTRPVGQGTGLGLSISHQIVVEKHGGKLHFHSMPGQGTEFVIELPCVINLSSSSRAVTNIT